MPELLTESFCERCGTRYTFESAAPTKVRKLGKFKTLSKGLKNYVMSDDTSLDEALAAARSDDERELTAQQLDAFHATFNFCMTCRQYTCANCWNTAEGRCLTCAPHLGHEVIPAAFADIGATEAVQFDASAWPTTDLPEGQAAAVAETADEEIEEVDLATRLARLSGIQTAAAAASTLAEPQVLEPAPEPAPAWPDEVAALAQTVGAEADLETEPELVAEAEPQPEPVAAEAAPEPEPVEAASEPEPVLAEATEPAYAVEAEPIAAVGEAEPAAEPELVAEAEPQPEPVAAQAAPEPEPVAAALEPEPVAAAPEPEPLVAEPVVTPEPVEAAPQPDRIAASAAPPVDLGPAITDIPADDIDGRAAAAALRTSSLLGRFRPGQSIDAELEAYEAQLELEAAGIVPEAEAPVAEEPEPVAAEPEPVAAEPEPVAAAEPQPELAPIAEPVAAEPEPQLVAAEEPQPELEPIAEPVAAAEPEPEPVAAAEPEPGPIAAEPEPVAAAAEPQPLPLQPEPDADRIAASAATTPTPADVVEQPTWRITAPDPATQPVNGHPSVEVPAAASVVPPPPVEPASPDPQWPAAPQWPQAQAQAPLPFLAGRAVNRSAASEALWAASARDVLAAQHEPGAPAGGVQPCSSCGLSLSASARFCRRCGTRQVGA